MAISGVKSFELQAHVDARGSLIALDRTRGLPFDAKRIFCVFDCPQAAVRGEHTVSSDMLLMAVRGSVCVDLDNGSEQSYEVLSTPHRALYVHRGVWLRLSEFSPGAVLLVACAEAYEDVTYYDGPVPDLLDEPERELAA